MRRSSGLLFVVALTLSCGGSIDSGGRGAGDGGALPGGGGSGSGDGGSGSGGAAPCPGCAADSVGKGAVSAWDLTTDNSDGVMVDADGALSLIGAGAETLWVWVANAGEGTVSKLDPNTGREVARYRSAVSHPQNGARPWDEACGSDDDPTGNCPSRTAIDFHGNAWVANRAFGHQGTVTKIAGSLTDCDQTGGADGVFRTSSDANGDGRIDIGDPAEFPAEDDCILFTVDVGGVDGKPRAVAVAPDPNFLTSGGAIWVGLNGERKAVKLDSATGAVLAEVPLNLNPYGALAAKALKVVWFTNAGWQREMYPDNPPAVQAVSYMDNTPGPRHQVLSDNGDCPDGLNRVATYGIGVDLKGRVWVGANPCTAAFRYDPEADAWMTVNIPGVGRTRGIVVDRNGDVWVAHSKGPDGVFIGRITRFSSEDGSNLQTFAFDGEDTIGLDFDSNGNLWGVSRRTNNVVRLNPTTGAADLFPVGLSPYTYSDFTGHSLLLQFAPGSYRHVFNPCPGDQVATWVAVTLEKEEPPGTSVEVNVRTADDLAVLQTAPWVGPWAANPAVLALPPGPVAPSRYLEVELDLATTGDATPRVLSISVSYTCSGTVT